MTTPTAFRLFIAIELPSAVRAKIKEHIDELCRAFPDVRTSWAREENLHLTLKFLGDTPVTRIEPLSGSMRRAANQVGQFEIFLQDAHAFPARGKPSVLWIGVGDPSGELHKLQERLEDECARALFARDLRPYHPHLTIGRMRSRQGTHELARLNRDTGFEQTHVIVRDLCLIRSELSSDGPSYTVIVRHPLQRE